MFTGIKTGYLYDAYGNVLQSQTEDSTGSLSKYIQTSATYTTAGTYVATQTDARGKVVTTVTDLDKGIATKVTDPTGQEVNSQYRYDDCGQITEIIDGGTSITYQ